MAKNYHKRTNYLKAYKSWCRDLNEEPSKDADMLSDYQLIQAIDKLLIKYDCLPFTDEEKTEIAEALE